MKTKLSVILRPFRVIFDIMQQFVSILIDRNCETVNYESFLAVIDKRS